MTKTAVAYCRFSSDNQREESISAQYRAIKKYCNDNNIKLIKMYKDEAFSARTDDRPEFKQMIKDSEKKAFDYVIVHKLDRFSRNRYDSAIYKKKLKDNNVSLVSISENLDGSPESIILESLLEGMNEYYSANLSREVLKGMRENAYQGLFNGGQVPLGYDIKNKKYVVNKHEAEIIRLIFDLYNRGYSYLKIANTLNEKGYRTKKGKKYNRNSFRRILKNELYYGVYTYNLNDETIKIENGVPPIVTKEVFLKAQENAKNRKTIPANDNYTYIANGLIYHDNYKMTIAAGTGRGKVYHYYKSTSDNSYHNADKIDSIIKTFIRDILLHPANINPLVEQITTTINSKASNDDSSLLQDRIKAIDKKINNIVKAISEGFMSSSLKDELEELENKKIDIETQIEAKKLENIKVSKDEIYNFIIDMKDNLNEDGFKIITNRLVNRINLQQDGSLHIILHHVCSHTRTMVVHKCPYLKLTITKDYISVLAA